MIAPVSFRQLQRSVGDNVFFVRDKEGLNGNCHSGAGSVLCVGAPQQDEEPCCVLGKGRLFIWLCHCYRSSQMEDAKMKYKTGTASLSVALS